ncbi:MAG: hypothetical protein VX469_04970 [Pseudomonadota bacterium]|nr:hypothetical protein [Pseudomonadota bacterium]
MTDWINKEDISQAIKEMRKEEYPDIDDINDDGELEDFADYIEDAAVTLDLGQTKEFGQGCVGIECVSVEKLQKSHEELVEKLVPGAMNSDTGKFEFVPAKVNEYLVALDKTFALKFQCLEHDVLYQLTFEIVYEDGKEVDQDIIKRAYYDLATKSSNPRKNEYFSEMYSDVS